MLTNSQKSFNVASDYVDWTVDYKSTPELEKEGLSILRHCLPCLLEKGEKWSDNTQIQTDEDMKEYISLWWYAMRVTLVHILFSKFWENCTREMYDYLKKIVLTYDRFVYDPVLKMLMSHECWCDISRMDKRDPEYKIREEYIK